MGGRAFTALVAGSSGRGAKAEAVMEAEAMVTATGLRV